MSDEERGTSFRGTDDPGTQVESALILPLPLKGYDESTWKRNQEDQEKQEEDRNSTATYKALVAFAQALREFTDARPGGKWLDRRIQFDRLIKDTSYAVAYEAGYSRGKRSGMREALGLHVDDLVKSLTFFVPNLMSLVEIYLTPQGQKPTDQQLRGALGSSNASALMIYSSPTGSLASPQDREELLKNTWVKNGMVAAKWFDEVERKGWLTTLDFTAAQFIAGLGRLSGKWVDGFFALNGRPGEQGEYTGRMVGVAVALVIWAASSFIVFEVATRTFILVNDKIEALHVSIRKLTLTQRLALLAKRARALLQWLEARLHKDIPDIFYRAFVRGNPKALERLLAGARNIKGGNALNRARRLKGSFIFEELIPFNPNYDARVRAIEQFLADTPDSIWQPKVYRARRMWVYQFSGLTRKAEWIEISDSGLVVFPKSGTKTKFRMGMANVFESKSAGVVEKAAASPEYLAGQIGKDFERLDDCRLKVEVEGLGVGTDLTIVEANAGELFLSRNPPRIEQSLGSDKRIFGTFWTVVAPPDAPPTTLVRTREKLSAAGFGGSELWLHPMSDTTAQRISEAVIDFTIQNP